MLGLLQAYGSENDSSGDSDKEEEIPPDKELNKLPSPFELPKPNFDAGTSGKTLEKSVFVNPYVEADNAKQALLEKHVKMISTDVKTVNGKKICWNYRKKKCRFGHNCKYAHDSDLQTQPIEEPHENKFNQIGSTDEPIEGDDDAGVMSKRGKKRPGLSATIVPSKKVMTTYFNNKRKSH